MDSGDGIKTRKLDGWKGFHAFVEEEVFNSRQATLPRFIWRGQRETAWSLSTTLDRLLDNRGLIMESDEFLERLADKHLDSFKLATRGRRGQNPASLEPLEWWALGQHFGLATPLLDWTRSPFAAAYFAFETTSSAHAGGVRVVYALDTEAVDAKNELIINGLSLERGRAPTLQVVDSLSNENPRLVSQGGLFTRAPIGMTVERWVANAFEGSSEAVLLKIEIPHGDRVECLRDLERMNINHASLFPDLLGASRATNLKLELYPESMRV